MSFQFRPAQRSQAKPLIGLYSQSGTGKTYGALLLARGFVGPSGRIGMIETESGRGEAYGDAREYPEIGGYEVLSMRDDFSSKAFGEAIKAAEASKLDALIVDSGSHEWESTGGVLDMAAVNQANGAKGVLVWQQPKILHKRHFMLPLIGCAVPLVILCMRAKYPMEEKVNAKGYKDWVRSPDLEPIQAEDVLYEMFIHGWIDREHCFHMTKCTSKSLEPIFGNGKPIALETGRQLAQWSKNAPVSAPVAEQIDLPALCAFAEAAADKGADALAAHWKTLPQAHRDALKPYGADLRKRADSASTDAGAQSLPASRPAMWTADGTTQFQTESEYLAAYEATVTRMYGSGDASALLKFDTQNKPHVEASGLAGAIGSINERVRRPAGGLDV